MRIWAHAGTGATIAIAAALLAACSDSSTGPLVPEVPAVTVVPVTQQSFAASRTFVGKTQAFSRVDLLARVAGFLVTESFTEDSEVAKDALLFEIDPAEYQAAVTAATAGVERARAALTEADGALQRTQALADGGTVSAATLDQAVAAQARARADLSAAQADLDSANLNLGYTKIHAPIDGRIGASSVDVGNLIGPDSGVLATVIDLDPMRVAFSLDERAYLNVAAAVRAGSMPELVPRIRLANGEIFPQDGTIAFADNQVDPGTGTVRVFVDFPNPDKILLPGQFVDIILTTADPEEQILIPQVAVQLNQSGPFVLVVNPDDRVELRQIATGARNGANIVVESGLTVGERIIVEGIQKVRPGGEVAPVAASGPASG